ncbi:MAG: paraquat-inducible protein A [Verrucomicrobiota bacterium]
MDTATLQDPPAAAARPQRGGRFTRRVLLVALALAYALGAATAAWAVIAHTQASTAAIERILNLYSLKNEGSESLHRYANDHPLIGLFVESPARHELELPSHAESSKALSADVTRELKTVRAEASVAAWWSWFLLSLSLFYAVATLAVNRSFFARSTLFALTAISVVFFIIGLLAPAMVIWTAPTIPMESGPLQFVVQHEVRGIAAIIWELLTSGHFIIGGFLLLFSIVTPMTKASLTFFVTACRSRALNFRIGEFLHTIGKWSMADVFVAAVLLALYALKFQEATKSIPCLGLYYFIGYCLLSLTTTELLVHSGIVSVQNGRRARRRLGLAVIGTLAAGAIAFAAATSAFTYEQYTMNLKQKVQTSDAPGKLNSSNLVLPAHK